MYGGPVGGKTTPVGGMGGLDAAQPLPPSMGGSGGPGGFKNGAFMGPTTADPNYAAQFHSFQQQLYATNTQRSHHMQPPMGPQGGPMPPMPGPGGPQQAFPFPGK